MWPQGLFREPDLRVRLEGGALPAEMMAPMSQDTTRLRETLATFAEEEAAVKIVLANEDWDIVHGFVVGLTVEWVALQQITDSVHFDGFGFYRIDRIAEVYRGAGAAGAAYLQRAIDELGRPPIPFRVPPDATIRDLVALGSESSALVWIATEDGDSETTAVGKVRGLRETEFDLQRIEANGVWYEHVDSWEYTDVTSVGFCTRYLEAFARFGDPLPAQPEGN